MKDLLLSALAMMMSAIISGLLLEALRSWGFPCLQTVSPRGYLLAGLVSAIPVGVVYLILRLRFTDRSVAVTGAVIVLMALMTFVLGFFRR